MYTQKNSYKVYKQIYRKILLILYLQRARGSVCVITRKIGKRNKATSYTGITCGCRINEVNIQEFGCVLQYMVLDVKVRNRMKS